MSNPALTWARKSRGLTPTQKLVLFVLADAADKDHICWNAAASIAAETGLSDRAVRMALHDLIDAGAIVGEMRSGVRPHWTLAVQEGGTTFDGKRNGLPVSKRNHIPSNRKQVPGGNRKQVPSEPETRSDKAETRSVEPEPVSDEPSITLIEPSLNPQRERVPAVRVEGFEDWWRAYPRKVGKGAARTAYLAAVKRGASEQDLAAALRRQQWPAEERFIPHARTWLTQDRWQDEPGHAAPRDESLTDTIASLMADPLGQGPPRAGRDRFDFEGTAEEIFRA